jgi:hypothetical protein
MIPATIIFSPEHAFPQTSFFIRSSEFHWIRGTAPPVVQSKVRKQLSANNFTAVADSTMADFIISIKCHSYYNGQTPYFFFALLDASLKVSSSKDGKVLYNSDFRRLKGGGTTLELADDKVYANASQIIADTLTRFMFDYTTGKPGPVIQASADFEVMCDADKDIPEFPADRKNTYVLIIANDAYSPLQMARCAADSADYHGRDARVFKEYSIRTLGIPSENISMIINGKSFEMRKEIIKLSSYSRGIDGKAELIFYYAGFGLIDEKTFEPYLLPVDIETDDPKFIIRISDLYKMLQEDASKRITILLETSFQFDGLRPRPEKGKSPKILLRYPNVPANVFFIAAGTPGQKAWSDRQAGHGLFTLSLLNELKETKGKASLKELSDFIIKDVRASSLKMKLKEQVPHVLSGSALTKDLPVLKL